MKKETLKKLYLITISAGIVLSSAALVSAEDADVTVIKAATGGGPRPYVYTGDDDELTGYDIEVLKAAFDLIPGYDLVIEKTDFSSVFSGLGAGFYQIGVNNFSYNAERAASYLYSVPYDKVSYVFVYKEGEEPITSFSDLAGKSIECSAGVSVTTAVEHWNELHPDEQINIVYSEADTALSLQHIEEGRTDFGIIDGPMYVAYLEEFGFKLAKSDIPAEETQLIAENLYAYYLFPQDQAELRELVDAAILELKENGTLKTLSEEYFGGADQSPELEALQETIN